MTEYEKQMYVLGLIQNGPESVKTMFRAESTEVGNQEDTKLRFVLGADVTLRSWVRDLEKLGLFQGGMIS